MTNPKDQITKKYKVVMLNAEYKQEDKDKKDDQTKNDQNDSKKKIREKVKINKTII